MSDLWSGSATLLRALVLTLALFTLAYPYARPAGLVAVVLGSALGTVGGHLAGRSRLRAAWPPVAGLLLVVGGIVLGHLLVTAGLVASLLGPVATLAAADLFRYGLASFGLAFGIGAIVRRFPTGSLLEVGVVALALVSAVSAHRDGMVNRPHAISGVAWAYGIDPVVVFVILGGIGSFVIALQLVREERKRRLPLHLAALVLLTVLLLALVRMVGVPGPRGAGDLGLTGEPKSEEEEEKARKQEERELEQRREERDARGREEERSPGNQLDELQFKKEYKRGGGEYPVAIVVLHGDYSPPSGAYYFRQSALSQFNSFKLVQATRDDVDDDVLSRFPSAPTLLEGAPPVSEQRVELETTVGLLVDHVKPFALDAPARVAPSVNPDRNRFRAAYEATSHVLTMPYEEMLGLGDAGDDLPADVRRHYTQGPLDPRYGKLAGEIVDGNLAPEYREDPLAVAVAVKMWLDKNGIYSRKSTHADVPDPTGSFLFGDVTGYCVHFAHAAAFLMRARGIPARVATGYAVLERDRGGGSAVMIRGRNAHAWPEVWVHGVGWVIVDPSPERSLEPPDTSPDRGLQRMLGEMMRKQLPGEPEVAKARRLLPATRSMLRALLLGLAGALLLAYLVKLYRALAPDLASRISPRQLPRVAYRAALDRLSEVGVRRRYAESRERLAERAAALSPTFPALTSHHLGSALGSRALPSPERARLATARVAREVRSAVPFWRWLLGVMNPISWMLTR